MKVLIWVFRFHHLSSPIKFKCAFIVPLQNGIIQSSKSSTTNNIGIGSLLSQIPHNLTSISLSSSHERRLPSRGSEVQIGVVGFNQKLDDF